MAFYAIIFDPSGNGTGVHTYSEEPSSYPPNEFPCSAAQAQNPMAYSSVNGQIVESLAAAKSVQSGIVVAACLSAESAPLAFTNAAGTASTFPMDSGKLAKYLSIYTKYYVKGLPFPNSSTTYNFYDVNGKAVGMTLTDIENFFNAVEAQVDGALAKQETLLADIASATTVTAVQAIIWW